MVERRRAIRPTGGPVKGRPWRGPGRTLRLPYAVHALLVLLGVLAIATSVRTAQRYSGISFSPPAPRTLVPPSAATYTPVNLHPESPATRTALDHLVAATGLPRGRLLEAIDLLNALGDRVGIAEWPASASGRARSLALIAQIKLSDVIALTQDVRVKHRVAHLRSGMGLERARHESGAGDNGVTVYRVTFQGSGTAYACIVAGDGVLATDLATANRIIQWNQR
jgi:hypothetical protein